MQRRSVVLWSGVRNFFPKKSLNLRLLYLAIKRSFLSNIIKIVLLNKGKFEVTVLKSTYIFQIKPFKENKNFIRITYTCTNIYIILLNKNCFSLIRVNFIFIITNMFNKTKASVLLTKKYQSL